MIDPDMVADVICNAQFERDRVGAPGCLVRNRAVTTLAVIEEWALIRAALKDISTLVVDESASPSFTFSNLCEAVGRAKGALEGKVFP